MSVKEVIKKLNKLEKDDERLKVCDINIFDLLREEGYQTVLTYNLA